MEGRGRSGAREGRGWVREEEVERGAVEEEEEEGEDEGIRIVVAVELLLGRIEERIGEREEVEDVVISFPTSPLLSLLSPLSFSSVGSFLFFMFFNCRILSITF